MNKNFINFLLCIFFYSQYAYSEITVIDLTTVHQQDLLSVEVDKNDSEILEVNNESEIQEIESTNSEIVINENVTEEDNLEKNSIIDELNYIWQDSEYEELSFLFEKIDTRISSDVIRSNIINILKYGSTPPKSVSNSDFDKLRVLTLKELGELDAAITVINEISTYEDNKELYDLIILEKNLIDYNLAAVCGVVDDETSTIKTNSYVLKVRIFCSYLNNKKEKAEFYNTLLLEDDDDGYFQALYNRLNGIDLNLKNIQDYNFDKESLSLYSAIMRSINIPFSNDFINIKSSKLLKAIALSPTTDIQIRIEAAQRAYNLKSLDSNSVAAIYQSVDFSSEELKNPLKTIEDVYSNNPQKTMALLFQSSRIQILPISRLEALNNFWNYANEIDESKLAYDLSRDLLASIQPSLGLIDFALPTAKAHFFNNKISNSKEWINLIEMSINTNNESVLDKGYLRLILLMQLKEGNYDDIDENIFELLVDNQDQDIKYLELYLTTLENIDIKIPKNLWKKTAIKSDDERTIPSIYMMKMLKESSENNLYGDIMFLIAVSMKNNNWFDIHPQHVNIIFETLKNMKKSDLVRDIAFEILEEM